MSLKNSLVYSPNRDRFSQFQVETPGELWPFLPSLCVHVGYQCNLKCPYCSSKNGRETNIPIDLDSILPFLEHYQVRRIVLSGGEPFLYPEKLQCWLPEFKKRGLTTIVATNGSMCSPLSTLAAYIDWVDVSLPATNKELYQIIRNENMFDQVLLFIQHARECGIHVRISYTVNAQNINDVCNLPELVKSLGVTNVRISHTYGTEDGYIWKKEYGPRIKRLFRNICGENIQLYTPLSAEKIAVYQKGYPILTPSGGIYLFNTDPENFVCHISDAFMDCSIERFSEIATCQQILFCKKQTD